MGDKTMLRMEMSAKPMTFTSKIISPITGAMMKGTMKKMINKDFDDLARACESAG